MELDGMMVIELLEHLVEHLVDAAQPAADLQEKVLRMRKTVGSQREIVGREHHLLLHGLDQCGALVRLLLGLSTATRAIGDGD